MRAVEAAEQHRDQQAGHRVMGGGGGSEAVHHVVDHQHSQGHGQQRPHRRVNAAVKVSAASAAASTNHGTGRRPRHPEEPPGDGAHVVGTGDREEPRPHDLSLARGPRFTDGGSGPSQRVRRSRQVAVVAREMRRHAGAVASAAGGSVVLVVVYAGAGRLR